MFALYSNAMKIQVCNLKANFRQLMIVGFIGDVDHDDVQGDPTQTAWMIWNTADPMTTNTNSACK